MWLQTSLACQVFETIRTCECKAIYTNGHEDKVEKKLLEVPPRKDCSVNIGCSQTLYNDCANYCMRTIRKLLGDQEANITPTGMNKICRLIAK